MASQSRGGRLVILDAAVARFERVGYHGASIRDIAAEADVTSASIYYHFKSKQQILQEIMIEILGDVIEETRAAVLGAGDQPEDQLTALVRRWIEFHVERQSEALIGNSEIRSLDGPGHDRVVALRDEQERIFLAVIDRGVAEGAFHTPIPREAARAILNMGRAVVAWYRVDGPTSPSNFADQYAELATAMVRAIKPDPSRGAAR